MNESAFEMTALVSGLKRMLGSIGAGPVVQAFVIGSLATGEACAIHKTSDIDVLLVVEAGASDEACEDVKSRLRAEHGLTVLAHVPLGLRCRNEAELESFSRYLALQGYHAASAVAVLPAARPHRLPGFSGQRASRAEFACVLAEALWGELRHKAGLNPESEVMAFHVAKSALAYVNLLLVGEGIFLPTHVQRVAHWHRAYGPDIRLDAALAAKSGRAAQSDVPALVELAAELRWRALREAGSVPVADDGFDPMRFWASAPSLGESHRGRDDDAVGICKAIACLLGAAPFVAPGPAANPAAAFIESLRGEPVSAAVRRIQVWRVTHSLESRRDWGRPIR